MTVAGYSLPTYEFARPPELDGEHRGPCCVAIVGAGLAGLTLAAELGLRGVPVVVLEQGSSLGAFGMASRGIAYSRRTLEILDRIGVAERVRAKGQTWNEGRIYDGFEEIYRFTIEPEVDQKWPAFINVQQFYVEQFLVERISELAGVEIRWQSRVIAAEQDAETVRLRVRTPEGDYLLHAEWLAACDGARSRVRRLMGLDPTLVQLADTWAIVDVKVELPGLQRRFWLNSPLIEGGGAIMHCMADGVVRADWQIGQFDAAERETEPGRVRERLVGFLGTDAEFEIVSISSWSYRCRVMDRLMHGRVAFAGDAAHELPPFGARGGNSGIQDAENLAWKLAAVIAGRCSRALLETYDTERGLAARENALHSCRSQAFITPHSRAGRLYRDAVIALARDHEFARSLVNTGRPSSPTSYSLTPLKLPDSEEFEGGPPPGTAAPDGPLDAGFLLDRRTRGFLAIRFDGDGREPEADVAPGEVEGFSVEHVVVPRTDQTRALYERYDAADGATYVLRPDSHVAGRTHGRSARVGEEIVERLFARVAPR